MTILKTNSIKLIAFATRLVVIFHGLILTIISLLSLLSPQFSQKATYLLTLFAGIILIYPFRLLKTAGSIKTYFYVLISVTLAVLLPIGFYHKPEYSQPDIISPIAFILNIIFTFLYYLHRQNSKLINPLLEKKAIIRVIKLFFGLFLLILGLGAYLFLDIRDTPAGKQYITIPGLIPEYSLQFTKEALNSNYKFRGNTYLEPRSLHVEIEKRDFDKMTGSDFIELYIDNRKVYRVDYDNTAVKQVTVFAEDGTSEQADVYYQTYGITKIGKFVSVPEEARFTTISNFDMTIHSSVSTLYRSGETPDVPYKDLQITITKNIASPERKIKLLPFTRTHQNWNLSLKDSTGTIPLTKKILIWY